MIIIMGSFSNNNCFLLIFLSLHSKRSIDIKQIIDIIEFDDDNWTAKTKNIIQTKTFSTNFSFSICLFLLMITLVNFCFVLFVCLWLHIDIFHPKIVPFFNESSWPEFYDQSTMRKSNYFHGEKRKLQMKWMNDEHDLQSI